jgi:Ca-activated chloride channel family protein
MSKETQFTSNSGDDVALKRVHIDGRIDGLLWSITSQQHYRNETGKNLETVYTFPLAPGAVLLGLVVQIGDKRLHGTVIEKKQATARYEKAIDEGDMPVMVEKSSEGLYTANLGNLKDGESVIIEIESAQLLRVDQGQMRLQIPTVIGERYGDAHATGGLARHETAAVDAMLEYPLTLSISVAGVAASAKISCPSHKVSIAANEHGLSIALERNSFLDRDFILNFEGLEGQSFAVVSSNDEESWVLASFCPRIEEDVALQNEPLHLKILIDCSGSMQGDSITQARNALIEVIQLLTPADFVSFSRFGSEVQHVIPKMESCTGAFAYGPLARAIDSTDANLGGTDIPSALASVTKISSRSKSERGVALLLITDGEAWDTESSIAIAQRSGHRIFCVGVGGTPAGTLLTDLAAQTGGACELVSPNEDIQAAILRTFRRMRSVEATQVTVHWRGRGRPQWQSAVPMRLYQNETLHMFAKFHRKPSELPKLTWKIDGREFECKPVEMLERQDQTLIRLGGSSQMKTTKNASETTALALKYQLLSKNSNLFLVHVRSAEDKATSLPALQQIAQMQAAGQSGYGTLAHSISRPLQALRTGSDSLSFAMPAPLSSPAMWRGTRTAAAQKADSLTSGGVDDYEIPAFLRAQAAPYRAPTLNSPLSKKDLRLIGGMDGDERPAFSRKTDDSPPKKVVQEPVRLSLPPRGSDILRRFNTLAWKETDFSVVVDALSDLIAGSSTGRLLDELIAAGNTREMVWAVYLDWLIKEANGMFALDRHAVRLLRHEMSGVSEQQKEILVGGF